jgi:hypothetical protein
LVRDPPSGALEIGATWQNGKLAGKTLREGLIAVGIDPDQQEYINVLGDDQEAAIAAIREALAAGKVVVGMGQLVCKALAANNIEYRQIVHPAARGKIRKTERYQEHLADRLVLKSEATV